MYQNCVIQNKDGTFLCYCNKKKIRWYIKKGIADEIDEHTIRLRFEAKGSGSKDNPFYNQPRDNKCVVCGTTEDITKHHVVPLSFRKHLDIEYKSSKHHDVLPVCRTCHDEYEKQADLLKSIIIKPYKSNTPYKDAIENANLQKFLELWRLHFIVCAKPQHLPNNWTVTGQHEIDSG